MNTTPDCSFEPIHKDIKRHAASGFVFSGATQVVRVVIQFASVVILARLLNPTDFGLMAMVWPIYNFALMFSNLGFNQAVVQKPDLTAAQINSFFWISSGTGLTICLLLSACSPAVGWFFHDPRAGYLTVAMAVLVLISGIGNLHGAIMMRRMEFRTQAIQNTISTVLTLAVSVIWALVFGGYWSLYAGAAAGVLFSVAAILWHVKWRPSRPAIAAGTWPMLRFGLGVAGGNFSGFVAASVSSFAIGHSLGESALGLYDRAAKLVAAPLQQMTGPLNTVVGPILFRLQDDQARYRRTFLRLVASFTLLLTPGILWVVAMPDLIITLLMGAKWREATPVFVALSLAALPQFLNSIFGWLFVTQGRPGDYARWGLFDAAVTVVAVFIGLPFGIVAVAYALAIGLFLRAPLLWWYACRKGPVRLGDALRAMIPQAAGGVAVFAMLETLRYTGLLPPMWLLICGLPMSYGVALGVVALFPSGRKAIARDCEFIMYLTRRQGTQQGREQAHSV